VREISEPSDEEERAAPSVPMPPSGHDRPTEPTDAPDLARRPPPTVTRRVHLLDLPPHTLADIARGLRFSEGPDQAPWEPTRVPIVPTQLEAGQATYAPSEAAAVHEPAPALDESTEAVIASRPPAEEPAPALTLATLPARQLDELARELFLRVVGAPTGPWPHRTGELPSTEDLYEFLRTELVDDRQRIDAFAYHGTADRPVVIVRPSAIAPRTRTLHRAVRGPAPETGWNMVEVWLDVPIAVVLNPPADLAEAAYYAADLGST
jgi:hypothetical protein